MIQKLSKRLVRAWARMWGPVGKAENSAVSFAADRCDFGDKIEGNQPGITFRWKREGKATVLLPWSSWLS